MILTGLARIGRDADVRYTGGGDPVANLSLAFNYGKPGADGKKPTQWVEASLWGKRAEALAQHLTQGTSIDIVLNDVHVETYQAKDGSTGSKLVGRVIELEFAGRAREAGSGQSDGKTQGGGFENNPPRDRSQPKPKQSFDDLGDDIPF